MTVGERIVGIQKDVGFIMEKTNETNAQLQAHIRKFDQYLHDHDEQMQRTYATKAELRPLLRAYNKVLMTIIGFLVLAVLGLVFVKTGILG